MQKNFVTSLSMVSFSTNRQKYPRWPWINPAADWAIHGSSTRLNHMSAQHMSEQWLKITLRNPHESRGYVIEVRHSS
eukprot:11666774-Ditylum_brightwellii.AAC.1